MITATTLSAASGGRAGFSPILLAKRFVNHLVTVRMAAVDRELRRLGQKPMALDAADFLPFKL